MKILAISDIEVRFIYSPVVVTKFPDMDLIIGCGDLPYYYLEYITSMLNVDTFFVRGNHAHSIEYGSFGTLTGPCGATDLHQRCVYHKPTKTLLAGIEGSLRYNLGKHQYSQSEMWAMVFKLVPRLFFNKLFFGRYLDIFVTHAPCWGIHDLDDLPHQGIKAFRWLVKVFQPSLHLHGHVHIRRPDTTRDTLVEQTRIINAFGYQKITMHKNQKQYEVIEVS